MWYSFFISCIIGTVITLFIAPFDPYINQQCIQYLNNAINNPALATVTISNTNITFLPLTIHAEEMNATCINKTWQWQSKKTTITGSLLSLYNKGSLPISITIDEWDGDCTITNGDIPLLHYFYTLYNQATSNTPYHIESITLKNAHLTLHDQDHTKKITIWFSGTIKEKDNRTDIILTINDCSIITNNKPIITAGGTLMLWRHTNTKNNEINGNVKGTITLNASPHNTLYLNGNITHNIITAHLNNMYGTCLLTAHHHYPNITVSAHTDIATILSSYLNTTIPNINGTIITTMTLNTTDLTTHVHIHNDTITYKAQTIFSNNDLHTTWHHDTLKGFIHYTLGNIPLTSTIEYNQDIKTVNITTQNNTAYTLPSWILPNSSINEKGIVITINNHNNKSIITYDTTILKKNNTIPIHGTIMITDDHNEATLFTTIGNYEWHSIIKKHSLPTIPPTHEP